ncbi:MAG TPA: hypothetical protein VKB78_02395 [Pirellulales bacterium]|nr:hypothetical protein [Pirellulales bacterium]
MVPRPKGFPILYCLMLGLTLGLVLPTTVRAGDLPASVGPTIGETKSQLSASAKTAVASQGHISRVVFIVAKNCKRCDEELTRLKRPGGDFETMRAGGWLIGDGKGNHIQIVDRDLVPDLVAKLNPREFPVVACIEDGEVVRSFRSGCTTPLDAWTFGFLAKGIDERPPGAVLEAARVASTGSYRLRGNHWSVEGDWEPTREKVLEHLHGPNHYWQLEPQWHIDGWSYEELRSLHDDLHERYDMVTTTSSSSEPARKWKGG